MNIGLIILIIIGSFLVGSIPTGYCIVKLKTGADIRKVGSGNIGTTNAMRAAGKKIAAVVFICDTLKGMIPSLLGLVLVGPSLGITCGLAAFLGHIYSPFMGFRGGKGVATQLGIVFALCPQLAIVPLVVWVLVVLISGYVSVASCLAIAVFVISLIIINADIAYIIGFTLMTVIVFIKHRKNFINLKNGTELKIKFH